MKIWIRHLDGNVEDLGKATEAEAIDRFRMHDWTAELEDYEPDKDGPDHCLPAFGIVDGERASCDITPCNDTTCTVNLYFHKPGRLFGIFPIKKNVWEHLPAYPLASFQKIVKLFYAEDVEGMCVFIKEERGSG